MTIIKHNIFNFDKTKDNDYEAQYLLWNDSKQGISMMFRYALLKKPTSAESGISVWGTFWDKNNPQNNVGIIESWPLSYLSIEQNKMGLTVADSGVNQNEAWGTVSNEQQKLSWHFDIDKSNAFALDRLRDVRDLNFFPNFASDYCRHKISGWIKVNDDRYEIEDINSSDGHYNNIQNLMTWSWGNCVNFKEDPDFIFEGISTRFNDWATPLLWLTFYWQGKRYETTVAEAMYINRELKSELEQWQFTAEIDGVRFECQMSADPQNMILLTHPLPDGNFLYTTITLSADLTIDIFESNTTDWCKVTTVTAEKTATFEVTKPIRNQAVEREFVFTQHSN